MGDLASDAPPAFEAIKGGEIAFIAVRSIKLLDERLDLTRVLDSFAEKGGRPRP